MYMFVVKTYCMAFANAKILIKVTSVSVIIVILMSPVRGEV